MKHVVLGCSVVSCKSGPPRLFCNRCETSHLMEKDLWFLLGEIFFSLLLLLFVDVFVYLFSSRTYSYTASAFPKIAEHTTMCSMLWTVRPPFFLTRERFLNVIYKNCHYIKLTILLLRAFWNLKLTIIFKIFLLFYL